MFVGGLVGLRVMSIFGKIIVSVFLIDDGLIFVSF